MKTTIQNKRKVHIVSNTIKDLKLNKKRQFLDLGKRHTIKINSQDDFGKIIRLTECNISNIH